jgi:predicted phosphodiesterase
VERVANELKFRSVQTRPGARIIAVGDIHGCYDELLELLVRIEPEEDDVVVSVGDVVSKGPAPARCLDLWRERGYLSVRGNNEIKLLEEARPILRYFVRENRDVLRRKDLLRFVGSWPLVIDFAKESVTIVHGGFLPHMNVSDGDAPEIVAELRWIRRKNGGWKAVPKEKRKKDDVLWAERWKGDRFVVYGHTPLREPKFDSRALGLDTGCVYGGKLTAAIFDGEWSTVSVKAKRKYA